MSGRKVTWEYANPMLHVVRKRSSVLAMQLKGEESVQLLTSMYLSIVNPESFDDDGKLNVLKYDLGLGVLWFTPTEQPIEMTVGDWLVYDGHVLSVVPNHVFKTDYKISLLHNKKERYVQRKETRNRKFDRIRKGGEDEWVSWVEG